MRATMVTEICFVSSNITRARFNVASVASNILRCSMRSALTKASADGSAGATSGAALACGCSVARFCAPGERKDRSFLPVGAKAGAGAGLTACVFAGASGGGSGGLFCRSAGFATGASSFKRASTAASRGVSQSIFFSNSTRSGSMRSRNFLRL